MNSDFVCWCCGVNQIDVAAGLCDECEPEQTTTEDVDYNSQYVISQLKAQVHQLKEQVWALQENMSFYQS